LHVLLHAINTVML